MATKLMTVAKTGDRTTSASASLKDQLVDVARELLMHNEALDRGPELRAKIDAEVARLQAELNEAQRLHDEWAAPLLRLQRARTALIGFQINAGSGPVEDTRPTSIRRRKRFTPRSAASAPTRGGWNDER